MTRTTSSGNSRCGDLVRYVLGLQQDTNNAKFFEGDEAYNSIGIFLDFEHCCPGDSELFLFQLFENILIEAARILDDISGYGEGATKQIRLALQNPEDSQAQREAFELVNRLVGRVRQYYDLAQRIEQALPNLLWELTSGPLPPAQQIDGAQALCKQLARIVDFVFRFDAFKMNTPSLQNDFSFYRRVISKGDYANNELSKITPTVPLDMANTISMFLANPTPMLISLSNSTVFFVDSHPDLPVSNTTETLATIIFICQRMLERKDFCERISHETRHFFLRVMVGGLILFDHIDAEGGAFCRNSPIDVKAIVELIKVNLDQDQTQQLMNALRYTSKHFSDSEMPKSIRALFN